ARFLILTFIFLLLSIAAQARLLDLDARNNALGSANSFGHGRIVRVLGELPMGGASCLINLVFNTNPADAPGAFGPYWRIPLLASTVVQYKQYKLYWDGPHERRQFFSLDPSGDTRRGGKVFVERGQDWKATIGRRGEVLIEALDESGYVFRYDEGRLEEFKLGDSAARCRVTYSGRGYPLYITNAETNRRIFEIEYRGATEPERIVIGEQRIEVEMGDGELTAPDGSTNYRNYRVSFLRSLRFGEKNTEYFSYSKADARKREVSIVDEAGKKLTKALDLAVNRMEIANAENGGADSDNWIEWEAGSGFVTADGGSTYSVKNDSWDPNTNEGNWEVTPDAVEMTRHPLGGDEQRWSYVWNSGVRVYTDLATGEVIRRTVISSTGPANGKLRKREVLKDGKWTLDRQNSYDPQGRPIRAVHGDSMRIWKWEDSPEGSEATEYLNGSLVRRTVYDSAGDFTEREIFKVNGDVDRYVYDDAEDGRAITHYLNGDAVSYKELDALGRLSYMKWADGREQIWNRKEGKELFLTLYPDGREYLVERKSNGAGYTQIEAPELIANAVKLLTQTR
ncbi:hypothetical protein QEH52_18950, partial [Coraliomargarita sp. SDUM461003]